MSQPLLKFAPDGGSSGVAWEVCSWGEERNDVGERLRALGVRELLSERGSLRHGRRMLGELWREGDRLDVDGGLAVGEGGAMAFAQTREAEAPIVRRAVPILHETRIDSPRVADNAEQ